MDKNLVNLAYSLLSELFKSEDETTPMKVSAVQNWLIRKWDVPEVDEALWRHFNERVNYASCPSAEAYELLEKVKKKLGLTDRPESNVPIAEQGKPQAVAN